VGTGVVTLCQGCFTFTTVAGSREKRHGTTAGEYFSFDKSKIKIVMNYDLFLPINVSKKYYHFKPKISTLMLCIDSLVFNPGSIENTWWRGI
jgi:hypothetical protein